MTSANRFKFYWLIPFALMPYFLPCQGNLNAQVFAVCSLREDNVAVDSLYMVQFQDDSRRVIYTLKPSRSVRDYHIKVNPNGRMVGLNLTVGSWLQDHRGVFYMSKELVIVDTSGATLLELPDVQRFDWSPDGSSIAVILGRDYEGFGFETWSLAVINVSGWRQRIVGGTVSYQDVSWAVFDSTIYATDHEKVYQINPYDGKATLTNYKGIYFSPDGRYYFVANYEGGTFGIYERETNRNVTPQGYEGDPAVNFHRWLPSGSTIVFGDIFREKLVYNVATGTVRRTITGQMLGYLEQTREFVVLKHHRYFPDMPDKTLLRIHDSD